MAPRVTYRRQNSYNTLSNKIRKTKTPGGRVVAQHMKKRASRVVCGETGVKLNGIKLMRSHQFSKVSKRQRTVSRAYGGHLSASAVKDRIIRAFLIEEVKIVKKYMNDKK